MLILNIMKTLHRNYFLLMSISLATCCICLGHFGSLAQQPIAAPFGLFSGQTASFEMHPVDLDIPGIHCIKIFDLDQDGDYDIVGGSEHTPYSSSVGLVWWQNEGGYPVEWTKFTIDGSFLHVMSVDVDFIDNDEFPDILASSWENGKIAWWRNSGNPENNWTSFDIATGWLNPHDAVCFDFDSDLDNDVIGVSTGNNRISIFYNQGGSIPVWQENEVASDFFGAKAIIVEDLNNDSLPDLICAGDGCDDIAWWENLGGDPVNWEKQFVTTNFNGSVGLDAEDMNMDDQLDIIGSGWQGNELSFWICNDIASNTWEKTMVTNQLDIAVKGIGRDFDLDGDKDIVAVGKVPGELALFFKEEDVFVKEVLFPGFNGGSALAVFDIDQDGDDDIISGAGILKQLYLFENKTITTLMPDDPPVTEKLKVFPNPSSGECVVTIPELNASTVQVMVFDVRGDLVLINQFQVENNQVRILFLGLEKGIYLIEIQKDENIFRGKLLNI